MIELKGKNSTAKVFTDNIDNETISQIIELLNQDFTKGAKVRIMSDCHSGKGSVIGFTADMGEKVIPNVVGVDLGCGMLTIELGNIEINLERLDIIINEKVPAGFETHNSPVVKFDKMKDLYCYDKLESIQRIENSIGTLGGGE